MSSNRAKFMLSFAFVLFSLQQLVALPDRSVDWAEQNADREHVEKVLRKAGCVDTMSGWGCKTPPQAILRKAGCGLKRYRQPTAYVEDDPEFLAMIGKEMTDQANSLVAWECP